jgi:hypothetical protein
MGKKGDPKRNLEWGYVEVGLRTGTWGTLILAIGGLRGVAMPARERGSIM